MNGKIHINNPIIVTKAVENQNITIIPIVISPSKNQSITSSAKTPKRNKRVKPLFYFFKNLK